MSRDGLPPIEEKPWQSRTVVIPENSSLFIVEELEERLSGDLGGKVEINTQDISTIQLMAEARATLPIRFRLVQEQSERDEHN